MNDNSNNDAVLACQIEAFNGGKQERYQTIRQQVQAKIENIQELPDGYAFRFPMESSLIMTLAEFITLERQCCSFFNFGIEVEADNGPLWLRLTGRQGVKEFLQAELGLNSG